MTEYDQPGRGEIIFGHLSLEDRQRGDLNFLFFLIKKKAFSPPPSSLSVGSQLVGSKGMTVFESLIFFPYFNGQFCFVFGVFSLTLTFNRQHHHFRLFLLLSPFLALVLERIRHAYKNPSKSDQIQIQWAASDTVFTVGAVENRTIGHLDNRPKPLVHLFFYPTDRAFNEYSLHRCASSRQQICCRSDYL